jgi:hypothetical protein
MLSAGFIPDLIGPWTIGGVNAARYHHRHCLLHRRRNALCWR